MTNRLIRLDKPRIFRADGLWWCGIIGDDFGFSPLDAYKKWTANGGKPWSSCVALMKKKVSQKRATR